MVECEYKWPKNQQGVYTIGGAHGFVYNVLDPSQHGKGSSFRFYNNEVVEMEYDPFSKCLIFENKTRHISHTIAKV